jgi:hypothetical protein
MTHVTLHSPQLRELDLSSCHKLSDAAIRAAAVACPKLLSLDTSFCSCVTDETLREISQACPALSSLDASNCPNISFEVWFQFYITPTLYLCILMESLDFLSPLMISIDHDFIFQQS